MNIVSQCATYIQMVELGIEGCSLPIVVETQQFLTPCSSPPGFWDLEIGEYAYVDYTPSGCANICQVGGEVDITCFTRLTGSHDELKVIRTKLFPTITASTLLIDGSNLQWANFYDTQGALVMRKSIVTSGDIDVSGLPGNIYYVQIITDSTIECFAFVKI